MKRCARLSGFLTLALTYAVPSGAAQPAQSWEQLRASVHDGEAVIVVTAAGTDVAGRLRVVSPSSVVVEVAGRPRTIAIEDVAAVQKRDSVVEGALIGAGVGLGLALVDYAIDPSEPGNAAVTAVGVGLGALVGAGVDALIGGNRTVYVAPHRPAQVRVVPLLHRSGAGVSIQLAF